MAIPFTKMHGLGNDFVLLDHLDRATELTPALIALLSDRRQGVGCDQVIQLLPGPGEADAEMRIYNADGSRAEMCGNASRCVALYMRDHRGLSKKELSLITLAGPIRAWFEEDGLISVDMGKPAISDKRELILADLAALPDIEEPDAPVTEVSMGNPHVVVFQPTVEDFPLDLVGPQVENHPSFPDRTNVEIVQVVDRSTLRMRVWERGAGITPACGTGACAAAVAATALGHAGRRVTVRVDGGELKIHWRDDGRVVMTGGATEVFHGEVTLTGA